MFSVFKSFLRALLAGMNQGLPASSATGLFDQTGTLRTLSALANDAGYSYDRFLKSRRSRALSVVLLDLVLS